MSQAVDELRAIDYGLYKRNELERSLRFYQRARVLCEQVGRLAAEIASWRMDESWRRAAVARCGLRLQKQRRLIQAA